MFRRKVESESILPRMPQLEFKVSQSAVADAPDRYIIAILKFSKWMAYITSADKEGKVEYGKRLILISSDQRKEIQLSEACSKIKECSDNFLLCGGVDKILLVNIVVGEQVAVLSGERLSLMRTCITPIEKDKQLILSSCVTAGWHLYEFYHGKIKPIRMGGYFSEISSVCVSAVDAGKILVAYNETYKVYEIDMSSQKWGLVELNRYQFKLPDILSLHSVPSSIDLCIIPLSWGGYIFRDRKSEYIAIKNEIGERFAHWFPEDTLKMLQSPRFQINEIHVLQYGYTFIVNFSDGENKNKVGVYTLECDKTSGRFQLKFEVLDCKISISNMIVDEENNRLVCLSDGKVISIDNFKPIFDAANQVKACLNPYLISDLAETTLGYLGMNARVR